METKNQENKIEDSGFRPKSSQNKICKLCGVKFVTGIGSRLYCSDLCSAKANRIAIQKAKKKYHERLVKALSGE